MTAFVPTQLGVLLPSDINDLAAAGIADGEFAKRVGGAWDGVKAVENGLYNPFVEFTPVKFAQSNLPLGDTTITPTIPAGFSLIIPAIGLSNVEGAGSITVSTYHVRGANSYSSLGSSSLANNVSVTGFIGVLQSGDSVKITTNAAGICLSGRGFLVPSTSRAQLIASELNSGDNLIYTCPASKKAFLVTPALSAGALLIFRNSAGSARTYKCYVVSTGNSPSSSNSVASIAVNNNALGQFTSAPITLEAEDMFYVNASGAGTQMFECVFFEVDA